MVITAAINCRRLRGRFPESQMGTDLFPALVWRPTLRCRREFLPDRCSRQFPRSTSQCGTHVGRRSGGCTTHQSLSQTGQASLICTAAYQEINFHTPTNTPTKFREEPQIAAAQKSGRGARRISSKVEVQRGVKVVSKEQLDDRSIDSGYVMHDILS